MKNTEALQKFGLTDKESKVYLASLELGKERVQEIAKKAGLSRSTTYSVLEALIQKRLIFSYEDKTVKEYIAENPEKIIQLSQERTNALKLILPSMQEFYRATKSRPKIKYYEGLQNIKEMYNDILRQKGLREYLIFTGEQAWLEMDHQWFEDFKKRRASTKIKTRLIVDDSLEGRKRLQEAGTTFSEVKILPSEFPYPMVAGTYIFSDKVIFTDYKKDLVAVEVFSKGIANNQRLMFEHLWKRLD